jgi:hypothetical protein
MDRRRGQRTVVVADAQLNTSLCVARSLRRAGYRVVAAGTAATGASGSASVARAVRVPSEEEPGAAAVVDLAVREGAVAILAHYERTTLALRAVLGGAAPLVVGPSREHIALCAHKSSVLEAARRVGVRIPETRIVDRGTPASELGAVVRSLAGAHGWPLFAKSDTELGVPPGFGSRFIVIEGDADLERLAAFVRARGAVLLQERIAGTGCGVAGLFLRGVPTCVGGHVRLREAHGSGGVSTYCESRLVDGALRSACALMESLGWSGVAMVEFKIPPAGPPVLMEVNPRFWGTLPLYVRAGADVPLAALEHALDGKAPPRRPFAEGRRMRFLLSDLAAIRRQVRGLRRVAAMAAALLETPWIVPDATFSLGDPLPFLIDVRDQLRVTARVLVRRAARSVA